MDCFALVDLHNDTITLFVPQLDTLYKIWMNFLTKEQLKEKYQIEVRYIHELEDAIKGFTGTLYLNHGVNSDSGLTVALPNEKYLQGHEIDKVTLHNILAESRVIKNDEEILAMRWASQITAEAHVNVMKNVKAG